MDYQCFIWTYNINTASNALERKNNKTFSRKMCMYNVYIYIYTDSIPLCAAFKMIYINLLFININHKGLLRYGLKYIQICIHSRITSYYVNARERGG